MGEEDETKGEELNYGWECLQEQMECVQMDGEIEERLWTLQVFSAERNQMALFLNVAAPSAGFGPCMYTIRKTI